ncbi:hypothetical protein M9H77_26923 [Catharanthus roseus]|uniref:Uncharacterized protein n=1 Tax=Catharanthus roseus TaxID=4058 RepID=A0ACC0ACX7_CATRO|nr:hypothetical protein M9H77_26923 [Catharanthus roseus]
MRWHSVVPQGGDERAPEAAKVVEDDEEEDFQTVVIDWFKHLQIRQEEIQYQLQIHQENTQNPLQSVEQMMHQCFSSDAGTSSDGYFKPTIVRANEFLCNIPTKHLKVSFGRGKFE